MIDCRKKGDSILRILFHVLVFLYLIPTSLNAQRALSIKDTNGIAPAFEFITLNSERISSGNLKGKIIILYFWSTDCITV
jgi:cytochrome oxidase Cu insertion factor (SCO1/SenC/PrrC family)